MSAIENALSNFVGVVTLLYTLASHAVHPLCTITTYHHRPLIAEQASTTARIAVSTGFTTFSSLGKVLSDPIVVGDLRCLTTNLPQWRRLQRRRSLSHLLRVVHEASNVPSCVGIQM